MNNQFPIPITGEADLDYYEKYLEQEFETISQKQNPYIFLEKYIGKAVIIDIISHTRSESRSGILKNVEQNFLILKSRQQNEYLIPIFSVKSITVLQNNTKLPHF